MNYHFWQKKALLLLRFLKLQLFISLISMPILLWWGLPLSLLSPIGNLIFAPILTIFLMLSSLLFFSELLHIPNGAIAWCLNVVTKTWLYLMNINGHSWLFGFCTPSIFFTLAMPFLALIILHCKKFQHIGQSIICFALLLAGSCFYIKTTYSKTSQVLSVACARGNLTIICDQNNVTFIDPGVLGQRISAKSWVEFTLVPHLIKSNGINEIETIIILQPSGLTFQALATLITKIKVHTIYLMCWKGSLKKNEWRDFFKLKQLVDQYHIKLVPINNNDVTLPLSGSNHILVKPLKNIITHNDIQYPATEVSGTIPDQQFKVYSQKLKKCSIKK